MYDVIPYYAAKILGDSPVFLILPNILTLIVYFGIGFTLEFIKYIKFLGSISLEFQSSIALGYFISCSFSESSIAVMMAPLLAMPLVVSGGFFVNSERMIFLVKAVQYISPIFYNFAALVDNEWGDDDANRIKEFLALDKTYAECLITMAAIVCVCHIISCTMLRLMIKRFQ